MGGRRKKARQIFPAAVLALALATLSLSGSELSSQATADLDAAEGAQVEVADNFELIGRDPLLNRAMNSAPAIDCVGRTSSG